MKSSADYPLTLPLVYDINSIAYLIRQSVYSSNDRDTETRLIKK